MLGLPITKGQYVNYIKKNKKTKIIAITDNVIPHEKRVGDKAFTRYFLKPVQGFITMSRSVMNDLDLFDRQKPRSLCLHPLYDNYGDPISREAALEALGLPGDQRYLLFFGLVRKYKGLDLLLQCQSIGAA